jgi:hypothetical protein
MNRLFIALCATISLMGPASAQTASDLAKKFPHHEVYEIEPGVQMTAKFASGGLVCEMQIEQTHFSKGGVDLTYGIDKEQINALIDRLVPTSERGVTDPTGTTVLGWGQGTDETTSYSNVTIRISSSHGTSVVTIDWRGRKCQG